MKIFGQKHWDKLVFAAIGVLATVIIIWAKGRWEQKPPVPDVESQKVSITTNDSSKVDAQVNQVDQENNNAGDVNNDFSKGKTVNHYQEPKGKKKSETSNSNSSKIDVNGNGNSVDQRQWKTGDINSPTILGDVTLAPPGRQLNDLTKVEIQKFLPEKKMSYSVVTYAGSDEAFRIATEIMNYVKSLGHHLVASPVGMIYGDFPADKKGTIDINCSTDSSECKIIVYPL